MGENRPVASRKNRKPQLKSIEKEKKVSADRNEQMTKKKGK